MIKCLNYSEGIFFADDTSLICTGSNIKSIMAKIRVDLSCLYNYFIDNDLSINVSKTNLLVFNNIQNVNVKLELAGEEIIQVKSAKFLGLHIDDKLIWEAQINHVISKMQSGLYALNQTKKVLDTDHKIMLYYAIIHSHLQYSVSIWGPHARKKQIARLQVVQNKCLRQVFNKKYNESVVKEMKSKLIPTVEELISLETAKLMFRIMNDLVSTRIINKFHDIPPIYNHTYNTRHRNDPNIPLHRTLTYSKSFLVKGPGIWLHLPESIKNTNTTKSFSKQYKKHLKSVNIQRYYN